MKSEMKALVENNTVEIFCQNSQKNERIGTGFFIEKDVLVTAYHVVAEYVAQSDLTALFGKRFGKKVPIEQVIFNDSAKICILKTKECSSGIEPLKFTLGFPVKHDQPCVFFGYAAFSEESGFWGEGRINTSSKNQHRIFDWKISQVDRASSYQGGSGSPVFIGPHLIGILQEETKNVNVGVISLGFSCIDAFKAALKESWYKIYSFQDEVTAWKDAGYKISTVEDKEAYLKRATKKEYNPLSLDFFASDDENFTATLRQKIAAHDDVYLSGICEEEMLYCVLAEFLNRLRNFQDRVVIVESEDTWNWLREAPNPWFVAIAYFHSDDVILPIPGKSNVFFYGEDDFQHRNDILRIRRRTRSFLEEKLRGVNIENSSAFFERTHGFFLGIKEELFDGKFVRKPVWKDKSQRSFLVALLCGKWTDSEQDKMVLKSLSGQPYDEFFTTIKPFMTGEEPFLLKFCGWNQAENYHVVDFELAWHYLASSIGKELWTQFYEVFLDIMRAGDSSVSLRFGMIRTLIFLGVVSEDTRQATVDEIIKGLLDTMKTKDDWQRIAPFLPDLCEASPSAVSKRLQEEISRKDSPVKRLFFDGQTTSVYDSQSMTYIRILWCLERLLYYRSYAERAVKMLFELERMKINYKVVNSPKALLTKVFCCWKNLYPIDVKKKAILAQKYISDENYQTAWDIIFQELPSGLAQSFILENLPPFYRATDSVPEYRKNDILFLYKRYGELCIEHIDGHFDRFDQMLQKLDILGKFGVDISLDNFEGMCAKGNDEGKFSIFWSLRHEIYNSRYYTEGDSGIEESRLKILERMLNLLDKTAFESPYMYYLYWFQASSNYDILNPVPFDRKEHTDGPQNMERRSRELKAVMQAFCSDGLKILELIKTAQSKAEFLSKNNSGWQGNIGRNLAHFYPPFLGRFNQALYREMLEIQGIDSVLYSYFVSSVTIPELVGVMDDVGDDIKQYNLKLYVQILAAYGLRKNALIFSQPEEVQKAYWEYWNPYLFDADDKEMVSFVLSKLAKIKRGNACVYILYAGRLYLTPREIMDYLKKFTSMDSEENCNSDTAYYLKELIGFLEQQEFSDEEHCSLANIEWDLVLVLDWETLITLKNFLAVDGRLYGKIVQNGYGGKDITWWKIYQQCKFCPGVMGGRLEEKCFNQWLDDFKGFLEQTDLMEYYYAILGKLFAHSPAGSFSAYPHDRIRKEIENIAEKSEEAFHALSKAYIIETYNLRGVYEVDAGKGESRLARSYQENMERLRQEGYERTAEIYERLMKGYDRMAMEERERAENEY